MSSAIVLLFQVEVSVPLQQSCNLNLSLFKLILLLFQAVVVPLSNLAASSPFWSGSLGYLSIGVGSWTYVYGLWLCT
jgi:hypothetical protein